MLSMANDNAQPPPAAADSAPPSKIFTPSARFIVSNLDSGAEVDVFAYLERTLQRRIMFLDGAMGTMIQKLKLEESHFRGAC